MPTPNRQHLYIKRKTRDEYQKHMLTLTDHDEIDFQLRLADTNLDTVLVQAEHLSRWVYALFCVCKTMICVRVIITYDVHP